MKKKSVDLLRIVRIFLLLLILPLPSQAASNQAMHLGAASCAGSTCHGATAPSKGSTVLQTEFFTWERQDAHSNAYKSLQSEAGQRIAANLGLKSAISEECLTCHTSAVPAKFQGKRYRASEGVSCEACHGGSEKWLGPHTTGLQSAAELQAAGMTNLADAKSRAQVCLDCHQGSAAKPVTHRLFGAGHPPLNRFELDTYTATQPAHYRVDADYRKRKPVFSGARTWLAGQVASNQVLLDELLGPRFAQHGMFPELAFYDCDACHHPMQNTRWTRSLSAAPGQPRILDTGLSLLGHAVAVMAPSANAPWQQALLTMRQSGTESVATAKAQAKILKDLLTQNEKMLTDREPTAAELRDILNRLTKDGMERAAGSYHYAAQLTQAIAAITADRGGDWRSLLDGLYKTTNNAATYDPSTFQRQLKTVQGRISTIN